MAYRFQVNEQRCINCGICVDLCPVRCLDMTRPGSLGEPAVAFELHSPIPIDFSTRDWMMLAPVQVVRALGVEGLRPGMPNQCHRDRGQSSEVTAIRTRPVAMIPPENGWTTTWTPSHERFLRSRARRHGARSTTGMSPSAWQPGKAGAPGWGSAKKTCGRRARQHVLLAPTQACMSA